MNKFKLLFIPIIILIFISSVVVEAKNTPIPNYFGLKKDVINKVFEDIKDVSNVEGKWQLVILPENENKACLKMVGRNGGIVYISWQFVSTLHCTNELAYIIGHEFAHVLLGHIYNPIPVDSDKIEAEADYLGYMLAIKAGYDSIDICKFLNDKKFPPKRIDKLVSLLASK